MAEEKKEFSTALATVSNTYMGMINRQLEGNQIEFNEYARRCVMNAIVAINNALETAGISWQDSSLDKSNVGAILTNIATLELNAAAQPSEVFFQTRNVKDGSGGWKKKIEYGVQGAGNEALVRRFGQDVAKLYPCWEVKEGDDFTYPRYTGVQLSPPMWTPKGGSGKVVRVVYPILHADKTLHYYIGEREDVKKNLLAHINNNLMNETFGIAANRYKATAEQIKKIDEKKAELKARARSHDSLEAVLDDKELEPYISPAWREDFSRESMIIRKMKNNVCKKIPKDFGSSFVQSQYLESISEEYVEAKNEIIEGTGAIPIDFIPQPDAAGSPESSEHSNDDMQVSLDDLPGVFAD